MKRLTRQIVTLTAALALPVLALPSAAAAAPHDRARHACIQAVKAETGAHRLRGIATERQRRGFRVTGAIVQRRSANDRFACNATRYGEVRRVHIEQRGRDGRHRGRPDHRHDDRHDDRDDDRYRGRHDDRYRGRHDHRHDGRHGLAPGSDAARFGAAIGAIVGSLIEEAERRP